MTAKSKRAPAPRRPLPPCQVCGAPAVFFKPGTQRDIYELPGRHELLLVAGERSGAWCRTHGWQPPVSRT